MHKSIATIESPQFINLQPLDINPLMSSCEIKVLYLGENRNGSFINEEVATEMAKTLRGAPIVGYYNKDKEDFADHGNRVIIDDEGIKFQCLTQPYGFVSPDAKVWFQTFEDTDDFGNTVTRKYLMTTGYLWTGQFKECKVATEEGRPHSMELDEETLKGHWERNPSNNMDFFIINDAIFSKLCILGSDVEPCFEGSRVTDLEVSSNFTKIDDKFKKTLFTMMQELQFALQGGQQMENEVDVTVVEEEVNNGTEYTETPAPVEEVAVTDEVPATTEAEFAASKKEEEEDDKAAPADEGKEEPSNKDDDEEEKKKKDFSKEEEKEEEEDKKPEEENSDAPKKEDEDEEEKKKKYALLETEFAELQNKYSILEEKYNELVAFKAEIEDAKKDEMIAKFAFLSEDDKKDVIENKSKYSIDEIESKLSVICVRNRVNFNLDNNTKNDINTEEPIRTYSLGNEGSSTPAWIKAVQNNRKN